MTTMMQIRHYAFIQSLLLLLVLQAARAQVQPTNEEQAKQPQPIQTASYVSLDGLTLVIMFDKPVNLSTYIESVELRRQNEAEESESAAVAASSSEPQVLQVRTVHPHFEQASQSSEQCSELAHLASSGEAAETQELVHGIQLCARLLSKKTLKLLHKYRLYDCVWPSRVQFLVQLAKPVGQSGGPIKISFQRHAIGAFSGQLEGELNEREISLELSRLPLESLGVPLAPRLAITGPNQVSSCGQFVLSAHLSSPFGTQPDESVRLAWSVERIGFVQTVGSMSQQQPPMMLFNGSQLSPASRANQINADSQSSEARWKLLQQLVSSTRANNLVLDSQLLQFSPQIYEFRLGATFSTSLTSVTLNATHQVSRLDFETPVGAIYGSHILAQHAQLNTNQDLLLLADIQVPDCAQSIKQVGLFWQVSDSRVRFEQTYAPYYLARPNSLPEQSQLEFRLNLFYGMRVKKYSTTSALVATGNSLLEAQISGGLLVLTIGQDAPSNQLELFASPDQQQQQQQADKYTYQWSCFDGKTAQPCFKSTKSTTSNSSSSTGALTQPDSSVDLGPGPSLQSHSSGLPLIDRHQQRQANLRLPLSWLDPEAQLWFGLQRFDRLGGAGTSASTGSGSGSGAGGSGQQSQTEYALVEVQPGHSASVSVGPVLVGSARQHRATLRNPLTGAILLLANSPAVVVGRLSPAEEIRSFVWHSPNYLGQLHWTWRNRTNPTSGQLEIITELHLSPQQQVAHAHSQIQLIACTRQGPGQQLTTIQNEVMMASLNLDTIQSVSQCRVGASLLGPSSLVVAVEHCNIPLGLSPITYQVYLVDSPALGDGSVAENSPATGAPMAEPDHTNEADVAFFESQAQPLTMPQLSPVFILNGFNPLSLAALLVGEPTMATNGTTTASTTGGASVRFGGRVCDRLQTCRTFYSPPVDLRQLLNDWQLRGARQSGTNASLPIQMDALQQPFGRQQASSLLQSLQTMIDSSKRANMAGNSIGAISILNAATTLGQRLLDGDTGGAQPATSGEQQQPASSKLMLSFRDRVRDLMQTSMRDSLHYGSVSLQRQFHYTDSGQTNLVLHALTRILSLPESSIELKFRALKLMAQLTRRTIQEQLSLKSGCVADLRAIQRAYESLFGTFTHYAIDTSDAQPPGGHLEAVTGSARNASDLGDDQPALASPGNRQQQWANYSSASSGGGGRRKRGQEAALAYLRSIRLAYRSLLAAAAIQLPLGESHQFRYAAAPPISGSQLLEASSSSTRPLEVSSRQQQQQQQQKLKLQRHRSDHLRSAEATTTTTTSDDISGGANKQEEAAKVPRTAATPAQLISSDTLSSLTHLTGASDLLMASPQTTTSSGAKKSIDVNFNPIGLVSIAFDQRFLQRLASQLREGRLLCRNDTGAPGESTQLPTSAAPATGTSAVPPVTSPVGSSTLSAGGAGSASGQLDGHCSSFVLAITSFAGKAPFRSLDEGQTLRVPHVEVSLLSPLDGSDLLNLQQRNDVLMAGEDIKTEVTFTIPNLDGEKQQQQPDSGHGAAKRRYKCYQFDEDSNEWVRVAQGERNEIEQQEKRIRCTFNGFGVFAAFQGKPPPAEAPLKSPVVIGLLALVVLIIIISTTLCCCSNGGSTSSKASSGASDSSEDGDDKRGIQRHPEQTHRSDFDYPRVGGG